MFFKPGKKISYISIIISMSVKNTYRLINPYIDGSLDTIVKSRNSFNAGKKMYNTISNYFTNHVEDFHMTLQNVDSKELTHFRIGEKRGNGNGTVDFNLVKLDDRFSPELEKKLVSNVEKLSKQSGGGHQHRYDFSSDSSSSSEDDYFRYPIQPITRFVYFHLPYYKLNLIGVDPIFSSRICMPMFSLPINPTLEIRFDLYKFI